MQRVPRVSGMFHWASAPPKRLKALLEATTVLFFKQLDW